MFQRLIIILLILSALTAPVQALSKEVSLNDYIRSFYNRHSRFLDFTYHKFSQSWHFDIPFYEPDKHWQSSLVHPRYHMSSAGFYKYRLDSSPYLKGVVRQAILDSTVNADRLISDQSFNDAIANFFVVRILEADKNRKDGQKIINSLQITHTLWMSLVSIRWR